MPTVNGQKRDPFQTPDDVARKLARDLIEGARSAAVAATEPGTGHPLVTRIALGTDPDGVPITLISDLSHHTTALRADARASLLIGDIPDPARALIAPRLTLQTRASFLPKTLRDHWLAQHPKAAVYVDFADFHFVRFEILGGYLNAGFARAYKMTASDLRG